MASAPRIPPPPQPTINRTSRQSLLFPFWQSQSLHGCPHPLCLSRKGRYLGNTSHLSGNCYCGRSRHKTLGFSRLRRVESLSSSTGGELSSGGCPSPHWERCGSECTGNALPKDGGHSSVACCSPRLACTQVRMLLVTCHGYSEELRRGGRPYGDGA